MTSKGRADDRSYFSNMAWILGESQTFMLGYPMLCRHAILIGAWQIESCSKLASEHGSVWCLSYWEGGRGVLYHSGIYALTAPERV